jgi:pimeloyl-ACP methyl ester carboxylesterase
MCLPPLDIYCEGSRTTKYNFTIILEHGGGTSSVSMMPLQTALSNVTRVCVYDRPGFGWSQLDRGFIHAGDAQREAHELFRLAGEQPPFVIGGHSAGGGAALEFRELYSNDVAGIFFIDSYALGDIEEVWAGIDGTNFDTMMKSRLRLSDLMRWFAPLGLLRWALANPNFPEHLRPAQVWSQYAPTQIAALQTETYFFSFSELTPQH